MKDIKLNTGIQTYRFFDEDDEIIAQFRLNPMDINLADRAMEVGEWFESFRAEPGETLKDLTTLNRELEEKIAYVLGCPVEEIFRGKMTATTVLPNGDIFAAIILDKIITEVEPQIEKRKKAMERAEKKYLAKYER